MKDIALLCAEDYLKNKISKESDCLEEFSFGVLSKKTLQKIDLVLIVEFIIFYGCLIAYESQVFKKIWAY